MCSEGYAHKNLGGWGFVLQFEQHIDICRWYIGSGRLSNLNMKIRSTVSLPLMRHNWRRVQDGLSTGAE